MSRRLFENALVVFGLLVLGAIFVAAIALVFFWRPSSTAGLPPVESAEARAARCAAAPSTVVVLSRARAQALAEGDSLASGARAEALVAGDPPEIHGYRLSALVPGALYDLAGLCDGDEVLAVGGQKLDREDVLLELYEKLKDSDRIRVDLVRRGVACATTVELR